MKSTFENGEFGRCRLCLEDAQLRESHIIPRWTYRRLIQTGSGDPNPTLITPRGAKRSSEQLKEYMLCATCEGRIEPHERYVADLALRPNEKFPARDQAILDAELSNADGGMVFDVSALDLRSIERFIVSVFWRASASFTLPLVSLGRYHRPVAEYLLDATASLPSSAAVWLEFFEGPDWVKDARFDRAIVAPHTSRRDGYHAHRFATFGFVFHMFAGKSVPEVVRSFDLVTSRRAVMTKENGSLWTTAIEVAQDAIRAKGGK